MVPALLALTLAAAPAAPAAMTGRWVMARDGGRACILTLDPRPAVGGFRLAGAEGCRGVSRWADDLHAWYVNSAGVVVLADPTRKPVLRFVPRAGGYVADGPAGDLYRLRRPQ